MKASVVRSGIWGVIVSLSGVFSGCAVLTVDVDVYKGSLVNEETVQIHQLMALTTAAKPMLVQLRDNLEWPDTDGLPPKGATASPKCENGISWYRNGYIEGKNSDGTDFVPEYKSGLRTVWEALPMVTPTCYSHLQKPHARRVNEILRLYETLSSEGMIVSNDKQNKGQEEQSEIKGLEELFRAYDKSESEFSLKTVPSDQEWLKRDQIQEELLKKLVYFAQNVLFTANHEGLLSPPGTPGLIMGGLANLNRSLFGDLLTDYKFSPYRLFQWDTSEERKTQYVRVLQAVGNSILFSVNELRERMKHHKAGREKVKAEAASVNLSYSFEPNTVFASLLTELQREKDNSDTKLVEATTRQATLTDQIGNSAPPLTGLRADEKSEKDVLETATRTLASYQSNSKKLKAIHEVLTNEMVKNIKSQWTNEMKGSADSLSAFLNDIDGLTGKIANARAAGQSTDEIQRFDDADVYLKDPKTEQSFQARRTQAGNISMKRADLLDNFVGHIRQLEKDREDTERELIQGRNQRDKKHKQIESEIAKLSAELEKVNALLLQLPKDATAFENARTVIDRVKSEVLQEIGPHDQFASPSAVYLLVATHLSKREAAETETEKIQQFKDAQTVLSKRTPPAGLTPLDPQAYQSPIAVMDELIALLRHRHIYAVERHGKGSKEDKNATEALESAYQHRAGMIYIRPSSAYLRTSFPSTSLQEDPNLAWDNMLLQQGIRNLPFSSQLRSILDPSIRRDGLLTTELDKQYWQNINRVRISGVGITNQVVAKDDVGNWYVKQYSGNTDDIVKSAKNLALFNLGMKLPIDLAGELKKATKPAGDLEATSKSKDDTNAETGADAPPLNRVLGKHRNAYQTKTTAATTKLQEMHTKDGKNAIQDQIVKAWWEAKELQGDPDSIHALKDALDVEIKEWDKTAEALKGKPDQDQGQLILNDLRALSRLEKSLSVKIQEIDKKGGKPREKLESLENALAPKKDIDDETKRLSELKAKATAEMRRVVGPLVLDSLKDRKQTLDSYEQAIMFIGDATNPKDSSQKHSN